MSNQPEEYDGINDATEKITKAEGYPGPQNVLADDITESDIHRWKEALTGFEANTVVTPEDGDVLLEILELFEGSKEWLSEYVEKIDAGILPRCTPEMVLFMVSIRDLQTQHALETNMNQHKLDVLQGGRYRVDQESGGVERASGEYDGSSTTVDRGEQAIDLRPPDRVDTSVSRIVRNTTIAKGLKRRYGCTCQVCGEHRSRAVSERYAEAHHIQPLGTPHNGPDTAANLLVLCPNHHADFDYGLIKINPDTLTIRHAYDDSVDGTTLELAEAHDLDEAYLEYHNEEISKL